MMDSDNYIQTIQQIKSEILKARYQIAKIANKELLLLYFRIGKMISYKVSTEKWGNKTIQKLSADLQNELPGLRGFSYPNLKRMRQFFEEWEPFFEIEFSRITIGSSETSQLVNQASNLQLNTSDQLKNIIGSSLMSQLPNCFVSIGFTSHIEIIGKTMNLEARIFYITKAAQEFWSVKTLKTT